MGGQVGLQGDRIPHPAAVDLNLGIPGPGVHQLPAGVLAVVRVDLLPLGGQLVHPAHLRPVGQGVANRAGLCGLVDKQAMAGLLQLPAPLRHLLQVHLNVLILKGRIEVDLIFSFHRQLPPFHRNKMTRGAHAQLPRGGKPQSVQVILHSPAFHRRQFKMVKFDP